MQDDEPLVAGEPIILELGSLSRSAPTLVNAEVVGTRGGDWVVHFVNRGHLGLPTTSDETFGSSGWQTLRHALRVGDETGRFRVPG